MKILKSLFSLIGKVLWLLILALTINLAYQVYIGAPIPMVFNYGFAVVQTGSMEPAIPTGSMIIIEKTDDYVPGDIIVFVDEKERNITHRIIAVKGEIITTQGDANSIPDNPVQLSQVIGEVVHHIPNMKPFFDFCKSLTDPITNITMEMVDWLTPTDAPHN